MQMQGEILQEEEKTGEREPQDAKLAARKSEPVNGNRKTAKCRTAELPRGERRAPEVHF
jgi:hypothetical protein